MVKVINGEIVPDDDPRAQRLNSQRQRNNQPFPNVWQGPQGQQQQQQQQQHDVGMVGPLDQINDRLRQFGIIDRNVSGHRIEPIFQVAGVVCLVFYGLPGLLVIAAVWFFTRQN